MEVSEGNSGGPELAAGDSWFVKLTEAGVEPGIASTLSAAFRSWPERLIISASFFLAIFGPIVWFLLFGIGFLESLAATDALNHASQRGGVLFKPRLGSGMLVSLFAYILLAGWVAWSLPLILRSRLRHVAALTVLALFENNSLKRKRFQIVVRDQTPGETADEFSRRLCMAYGKFYRMLALPLLVASFGLTMLDLRSYTYATIDAVVTQPWLPWTHVRTYKFSDASFVELGCNYTDEGGWVEYTVHFPDGAEFNLGSFGTVSGEWIGTALRIDQKLLDAGVELRRWKFRERDPMHPLCLARQGKLLSPSEPALLHSLLRSNLDDGVSP